MKIPRQVFVIAGCAPVLAAVMVGSMVFNEGRIDTKSVAAQAYPTPDPCLSLGNTGGELTIAGEQCVTPTEETLPKTHTPEPKPTDAPKTEVPNTQVPPTKAAATNTPSGGAGAGGLKPPSTGTGGDASGSSMQWLVIAGGLMAAVAGVGSLGYGARRK